MMRTITRALTTFAIALGLFTILPMSGVVKAQGGKSRPNLPPYQPSGVTVPPSTTNASYLGGGVSGTIGVSEGVTGFSGDITGFSGGITGFKGSISGLGRGISSFNGSFNGFGGGISSFTGSFNGFVGGI